MTIPQITLFAIFAAVMVLMYSGRWRHDLVAFAGLMAGVVTGVVPANEAFSGFGHPATMVVALILIATAALMRSGAVAALARMLVKDGRPVSLHILVMSGIGAFLSGFMNNIAALALLMPIDMEVARRAGRAAGLTLMPLAFATILGGMLTMIGTPPNIIVSGFRQDVLGAPFRMFDFLPVGAAVTVAGVLFVALIGWRLIPRRDGAGAAAQSQRLRRYQVELVVPEESPLVGTTLPGLQEGAKAVGIRINRLSRPHQPAGTDPAEPPIAAGDVITLRSPADALDEFRAAHKLAYPDGRAEPRARRRREQRETIVEYLVPAGAPVIGRSAQSAGLINRHDTVLLGLRRRGRIITAHLRQERIEAGDLLLLLVPEGHFAALAGDLGLVPLEGTGQPVMREWQMALTLGLFVGAVTATSIGWVTMPVALGCIVVAYVLFGVLSVNELYDHIDWPVIVLLGSMIPLGLALDATGGTSLIAAGLVAITDGFPAWVALVLLMATTMSLSDVLNNNATTIIAAPVGIRLAEQLGVNPDAFLMGVAVSAACAFLTPIGHQNNTLILGPGDYRFGDYWRMGLPLEVIVMLVSVPMLLIVWPL
ncbi:MAG: SLC13 family permease [Paracoccus sp. (in: a-proteobacteria)]|nr:SLC13 family permease [Paracoccus sp. (in: a-proteobacteria)]